MKVNLDIAFTAVLGLLLFLIMVLFTETKSLQTEIDELRIIVDQKFLPAMILEQPTIREEYATECNY